MAATQQMTVNPQKFTNTADTNDHNVDLGAYLAASKTCTVLIDTISSNMYFGAGCATVAGTSAIYGSGIQVILQIPQGQGSVSTLGAGNQIVPNPVADGTLHYRGAAGNETFQVTVIPNNISIY